MTELLASTIRLSTPLLFASMGGILCERAGIATICLEGVLLMAAWTAATVNFFTGDPALALATALIAGAITMSLHAFLTITAKSDQIISGVVVNFLAMGLTPVLNNTYFNGPTNTDSIPLENQISHWTIPGLSKIPGIGQALFDHVPLVYVALALPFAVHYLLKRTRFGLWIRASGDSPETLKTAGISPAQVRYAALILGGMLVSLGGAYLSIAHTSQFTRDMSAGRGFIALAALIFGKWKPLPTFIACLFFGLTDALQIQLQGLQLFGTSIPVQFIQMLPYLVTLIVLVAFVGRARAPLSIGLRLD